MPIFPVYGGVSTNIAVQTNPNPPRDPQAGILAGVGQTLEQVGLRFAVADRKKREMIDEADVLDRAAQAVGDMDGIHEDISSNQEKSLRGKAIFDEQFKAKEAGWYEGLSPRARDLLKRKIYGRSLEYRIGAGKIENRAVIQKARGALDRQGQMYVDIESRRINPNDATDSPAYLDFIEAGNALVLRNGMTPEEWVNAQKTVLANGAYARAHKIIASESATEIKHFLNIVAGSKEASSQDTDPTFLRNIKPDQRNTLESMAKERINSLRAQEVAAKNQEWTDTQRQHTELQKTTKRTAALRLSNPEKYGRLTREWVETAAETGMLEGEELTHFRTQAETIARGGTPATGGFGNAAVVNRYSIDVFSTRSPEQALALRERLLVDMNRGNVPSGPNSIGSQWLGHLTNLGEVAQAEFTPRMKSQKVKELIKTALRVSGPGAPMLQPQEQAVMTEALEALTKNEMAGYPLDPFSDIYLKNIDKWQARIGAPAQYRAAELARSQGLGYSAKGDNMPTWQKQAQGLKRQFDEAPPGPEGDATRNAIRESARALRRLQELDAKLKEQAGLKGQAKQQREEQKSAPSGPVTGPRQ